MLRGGTISLGRANRTFRRRKQINHCQLNHLAYACERITQGKGNKVSASSNQTTGSTEATSRAVQTVLDALEKLRFGAIQLTVHEGKLVQVDVTERHRYPN